MPTTSLSTTCPANATPDNCVTQAGTGLKIISPPYAVSAVEPARWRNNNCFDSTVTSTDAITTWGTEYDWMGFFYATNTQSAARSSMGDLFAVYKQACGGGRCSGREPDWGNLEAAAETRLSPVQRDFYRNGGRRFGVSRDVSR